MSEIIPPLSSEAEDIWEVLRDRYDNYAKYVTKIFRRPDLHMAVDIAMHSVLHFNFNNTYIQHGWIDMLLLGDTRTGKNSVAEGLARYYGAGSVITGENSSYVGLVGGVPNIGGKSFAVWGMIVLLNRRLAIIDEMGGIPVEDLGRMSRVRSEGIGEISKGGFHYKAKAATRLIWMGNPRSKKFISDFNSGVEAILEMFDGRLEDVARLTYALTISHDDVDSTIINRKLYDKGLGQLKQDFDRKRLLFAWSRQADQVVYTEEATEFTLKVAEELGRMFSPRIPLIQVENGRIKLAQISVAFAAAVMSVDKTFTSIIVRKAHVECARRMLLRFYCKPIMGYYQYSEGIKERSTLRDENAVNALIDSLGDNRLEFINQMLNLNEITVTAIAAFSRSDRMFAKEFGTQLMGLRALRQEYSYFVKSPAFTEYLRKKKLLLGGARLRNSSSQASKS